MTNQEVKKIKSLMKSLKGGVSLGRQETVQAILRLGRPFPGASDKYREYYQDLVVKSLDLALLTEEIEVLITELL